ncbi:glycosyltransferase family 4 protein [Sagittula sp. NFXS13]|uniref:glycosyltransferase family 4 protein n=1 Tax=Sagittula sp. NFXS13 TaxID=2819095 RepID=UPI0032DF4291
MNPIKVLFPYTGTSVGGSHISSLILAQSLPRERYTPVVALHEDGPLCDYLRQESIDWIAAPAVRYIEGSTVKRGLRRLMSRAPLAGYLRTHGIGLVHTQDMRMHMTWGPAARAMGLPHVWHQRTPAKASKHARAAVRASAVIAVSDYIARGFPADMRAKAEVVYNPFAAPTLTDREAARHYICQQLGLPVDARFVCCVANLAPRKRPLIFVDVARRLKAMGHDTLHFLMIGAASREMTSEVVAAVRQVDGLEARFHLTGTRHPVSHWIGGSDVLVAPAVQEAFGRTLVEAQMLGTPVVASEDGGHTEIIESGKTGILVPPDDAEHMAQAVDRVLTQREVATSLAEEAQRAAVARFSTGAHVTRMRAVYDRVTSGGH